MLPSIIPLSAVPVTSQLDPPRQAPAIAPVVAVQPGAGDSTIDLKNQRDPDEQTYLLREEQRQQQGRREREREERYSAVPGDELNADNTVPVVPLTGDSPRQGLLVDIEI